MGELTELGVQLDKKFEELENWISDIKRDADMKFAMVERAIIDIKAYIAKEKEEQSA